MKEHIFIVFVMLGLIGPIAALRLKNTVSLPKLDLAAPATGPMSYYSAVKQLKATVLTEQTANQGKTLPSTQRALWLKLKKEFIDKSLRKKAFIKDGELVVTTEEVAFLTSKLIARVRQLSRPNLQKNNRMVATSYAKSRARDLLRRHGYHNQQHVTTILEDLQDGIEKIAQGGRIALAKLEDLTIAAMKRFRTTAKQDHGRISRFKAEVQILKAIRKANLTGTKEIAADTRMMDALNKQAARGHITQQFVDKLIQEIIDAGVKKPVTQKRQKRGKD